jgi:hypothetical protein
MMYLDTRSATLQDRRAALLSAIQAAATSDDGAAIVSSIVAAFRERGALLPAIDTIERIGLAGRAIARRRAETTLIKDVPLDTLRSLDRLLEVEPSIGQTRFHWLRSAPEAPGSSNLVGLIERIAFLRQLEIDPTLEARISAGRWGQMIREGNATPAWLTNDFNASRRHALIVAQVIKLCQKLTDDAVTMFIKLMGKLFSQANNRKKQRQMDCRANTAKALRMFLDTITALQSANNNGRNAMDVLDQRVGWDRLLRMKPELESMVDDNEAPSLIVAAEQYATVHKYTGAFLRAFTFRSARRHDPLLAAIALLKRLHAEKRRTLPDRVPLTHLSQTDRRLIFEREKPDRRLYEIATLAALRDRLRSAEIWVDGSRSFRPIDEHLMPRTTFITLKEEDRLGLGVQADGAQWLAEARQMLDFNLQRLAHRARSGKLEGVRLEAGTLIITPTASEIPAAAEALNAEISDMYPLVEVPDLLRECMNGPALRISSRMFGPATYQKMSLQCSLVYWPMLRTLAPNEWRALPKGLALTRLGGCAHSTRDRRHTARLKRASPMPTPSIRIRAFGAMAQRHRPMANSSVRATGLQSAATSICITVASPDRNSIAICQINTATSAFCPSVPPRARRPMCWTGSSIRTRSSISRSTLPTLAVPVIICSGCSP